MRFRATLELGGKTATGIHVPDDIVAGLGSSRRPAVWVTIGSHSYRSTVARMGGRFMLPVSAEHRASASVSAGDEVVVGLELDTAPREVEVPADFGAALAGDTDARRFFDSLSYSKKSAFVLDINQAKKADTRRRRVDKAITILREGRARS